MILAINAGSTSLKYKLFSRELKEVRARMFSGKCLNKKLFKELRDDITARVEGGKGVSRLKIVHRVVHGGTKFSKPVLVSKKVIKEILKNNKLAPLHNPYNAYGIRLARKFFKGAKQYAVFDTSFYKTLPEQAKRYPLPNSYKHFKKIQRFGFHGISHKYCLEQARIILKKRNPNLITIHLGGGCSITAIKAGKAIDTSMGYTPMEGLMMWSRAGDIDPYITLMAKPKMRRVLNYEAGIKGVSGCKDYLDLLDKVAKKDKNALLAFNMFCYRIKKYIGAYFAVLGGRVDAIIFTGRVGAGEAITRQTILKAMPFLRKVKKIIIEPDEELMMARLISNF